MSSLPSLEVLQDHLVMLGVAKPSVEDCAWIKLKAKDLFEFSGGDKVPDADKEDIERRTQLKSLSATKNVLAALDAMTNCASAMPDANYSADHIEAVYYLLKIIRNLARDDDESTSLVKRNHAIGLVRDALIAFGANSLICREGFGALANFAVPPSNRAHVFAECGSILVAYLRRHSGDVKVAQNGCACLMNIANNVDQLDELGNLTAPALFEVGTIHANDVTVAEHVQSTFSALLMERQNIVRFLANGSTAVIGLILNLVRTHPKNAIVAEHGLRSIYSLAQIQENKSMLRSCGGFEVLQTTLIGCPFPAVAEWGCKATRALAHNNAELKQALYDAGAATWVIEAVRAHGMIPAVAKVGLGALWSLANNMRTKAPMVNRENVHIAIINTLRLVPDSPGVALTGTAALASLANDPSVRRKMLKDGVVTAVLRVLRGHQGNFLVSEHSCGCLWSLCMDHEVQKEATRDTQVIRAIIEAMTLHPDKSSVILKGLGALEHLANSRQGAMVMVHAGAIPVVASLLKVHIQNDLDIILSTCSVLTIIAHHSDDLEPLQKYGVAEIAIDVQRLHPTDEWCNRAAERLLTSLEGGGALVPALM